MQVIGFGWTFEPTHSALVYFQAISFLVLMLLQHVCAVADSSVMSLSSMSRCMLVLILIVEATAVTPFLAFASTSVFLVISTLEHLLGQ
jgi:hypothetical protein